MNLLDENIRDDQRRLLRSWRIRASQVGSDVGRKGMKDEQHILPLLRRLDRPKFFTRDLGFLNQRFCHSRYSIICLAVNQSEVADFIRRVLRHRALNTKARRMGAIVRVSRAGIRVWRAHEMREEVLRWSR
jgi:hypothetical protein